MPTQTAQSLVITPEGEFRRINLAGSSRDRLNQMYEQLGCDLVDVVRLTTNVDMWLDDEGVYSREPNLVATALAQHFGYVYQPYFGPVLLCSSNADGDSVDLTGDQVEAVLRTLLDITDEG